MTGREILYFMELSSQRWHDKCVELKSDNWDGKEKTDSRDILDILEVNQ